MSWMKAKNNNKVEKRVIHFLNSYHIFLEQILGPHGTGYINYVLSSASEQ